MRNRPVQVSTPYWHSTEPRNSSCEPSRTSSGTKGVRRRFGGDPKGHMPSVQRARRDGTALGRCPRRSSGAGPRMSRRARSLTPWPTAQLMRQPARPPEGRRAWHFWFGHSTCTGSTLRALSSRAWCLSWRSGLCLQCASGGTTGRQHATILDGLAAAHAAIANRTPSTLALRSSMRIWSKATCSPDSSPGSRSSSRTTLA